MIENKEFSSKIQHFFKEKTQMQEEINKLNDELKNEKLISVEIKKKYQSLLNTINDFSVERTQLLCNFIY